MPGIQMRNSSFYYLILISFLIGIFLAKSYALFLFILLVSTFLIYTFFQFRKALLILTFLIPFGVTLKSPISSIEDIDLVHIIVTGVFGIWILRSLFLKEKKTGKNPLSMLIIVYLFLVGLSIFQAKFLNYAIFELIRLFLYWMIFLLIINNINNKKQVQQMILILILVAFLSSVYALYQYTFGVTNAFLSSFFAPGRKTVSTIYYGELQRIPSIFGHPNMYATYLIMIIPLAIGVFLFKIKHNKILSQKVLFGIVILFLGVALILTFTRGAIVCFLIGSLLITLTKKTFGALFCYTIPIFLLIIIGMLAVKPVILISWNERIKTLIDISSEDYLSRFIKWEQMLFIIRERPLTGIGINQLWYIYGHNGENVYLNIACETGLLSLLVFIFHLLVIYKKSVLNCSLVKDTYLNSISSGLLWSISSLLLYSLFDPTVLSSTPNLVLFGLLVGLIMKIQIIDQKK